MISKNCMKFSEWDVLHESLTTEYLKKESEIFKNVLGKNWYAIINFETFKRPGESEQHSNLFTNSELHTFATNYTTSGSLHSIDIWRIEGTKPFITYYVKDSDSESVAKKVAIMIKNPNSFKGHMAVSHIHENEDSDLIPSIPKPIIPVLKKDDPEYDFADPDTIFEDLKTYITMLIKGEQPSLLITGSPGIGKTHTVLTQLKEAGLEKDKDFISVKGRSTAAGMYISLYENNGKFIVFDDCDSVFGNDDAVNILKGALDSYGERSISWLVGRPLKGADGSNIPKTFNFTGKVIFISNKRQKDIDDAIKSRSFVIEVALTPEDMLIKMRKELKNVSPDVPLPVKEEAMDFIESVAADAESLELNMRTLIKTIKILGAVSNMKVAKRLILQQCSYK